jgi:hypothetical protein
MNVLPIRDGSMVGDVKSSLALSGLTLDKGNREPFVEHLTRATEQDNRSLRAPAPSDRRAGRRFSAGGQSGTSRTDSETSMLPAARAANRALSGPLNNASSRAAETPAGDLTASAAAHQGFTVSADFAAGTSVPGLESPIPANAAGTGDNCSASGNSIPQTDAETDAAASNASPNVEPASACDATNGGALNPVDGSRSSSTPNATPGEVAGAMPDPGSSSAQTAEPQESTSVRESAAAQKSSSAIPSIAASANKSDPSANQSTRAAATLHDQVLEQTPAGLASSGAAVQVRESAPTAERTKALELGQLDSPSSVQNAAGSTAPSSPPAPQPVAGNGQNTVASDVTASSNNAIGGSNAAVSLETEGSSSNGSPYDSGSSESSASAVPAASSAAGAQTAGEQSNGAPAFNLASGSPGGSGDAPPVATSAALFVQPGGAASELDPIGSPSTSRTPNSSAQERAAAIWQTDSTPAERILSAATLSWLRNGAEMRVQLHSDAFGPMEIHAVLSSGRLGAAIGVESIEAQKSLLNQLPALHQSLAERNVQLDRIVVMAGSGQSGTEFGSDSRQSKDDAPSQRVPTSGIETSESSLEPSRSVSGVSEPHREWGRLNVRA